MFNRKKREKELKEQLKKEILKELKQSDFEENKKSNTKPVKEPVLYHSKEELQSIRESFLKIFIFSTIVLFIIIALVIIGPKTIKKENENNEKENLQEEIKKETLVDRQDGVIENINVEILNMFNMLNPKNEDLFVYDSTYLYSKDEFIISEIPDNYLLYIMSKSNEFNELINSFNMLTKAEICSKNGNIKIPESKINDLMLSLFDRQNIKYEDFIYTHYVDNSFSTYIRFTYSDGYYVSFCDVEEFETLEYNSVAIPMLHEASKENNFVKIKVKVAFLTKNNVYSDYELKNVISTNVYDDILSYILKADEYEYYYVLKNKKYILDKIVKLS